MSMSFFKHVFQGIVYEVNVRKGQQAQGGSNKSFPEKETHFMSRIENMKGKNDKTQDREEQMQRGL